MKKVYEHIDFSRVGQFQSILENEGIPTHIKNLGSSAGMGEIPFIEIWPELWVVNDDEHERALEIVKSYAPPETETQTDWTCPGCDETVGKEFGECWNCQTLRPSITNEPTGSV